MEIRWRVLLSLFYPLSIATVSAGLIAFLMLVLKMDPLLIGAVTLWFYFISTVSIYVVTKEALRAFGVHTFYFGLMITIGIFAILASLFLLLGFGP